MVTVGPRIPRTIGLVLAGGRATRFGGCDKALLTLGGRTLLARAISALAPQVDTLALSSNAPPERYADYGLPVLPDMLGGFRGPLAGVHAALFRFPDDYVLSVAVDLPFLPHDLVSRLRADGDNRRCRYAMCEGRHALAILWPPRCASTLEHFLMTGSHSVAKWLEIHGEPVPFLPGHEADMCFNVNTPADLDRAEARLATKIV